MRRMLLAMLLVAWAGSAAASVLIRADKVRKSPSNSAEVVAKLASGTPVDVIGRKGGWLQIKGGGQTGWVRLLSVGGGGSASGSPDVGGVVGLATKRNDQRVVATAGLRGLNEEDLKSAKYDAEQIKLLDSYTVTARQAEAFAAKARLQARHVAFLPAPKETSGPSNNSRWEGLP